MRHTREAGSEVDADGLIRRQKMTTWGILALAVFVSLGMAEWSKRTAASETVIDPAVMDEAIKIAAARDSGVKGLRDSESGKRISDAGKNLSDLGVSAVKPAAAAALNVKLNENLGGELANLESGKRISDLSGGPRVAGGGLPATSNPKHATLRSESVATMQTSAGE